MIEAPQAPRGPRYQYRLADGSWGPWGSLKDVARIKTVPSRRYSFATYTRYWCRR